MSQWNFRGQIWGTSGALVWNFKNTFRWVWNFSSIVSREPLLLSCSQHWCVPATKGPKFLFVVCSAASCEVELPVPGQHLATTQGFMDLELWAYFEPLLKFHTNTAVPLNPPIFHEISL